MKKPSAPAPRKALERFRIEMVWKRMPAGKARKRSKLAQDMISNRVVTITFEGLILQVEALIIQKCFDAVLLVPFHKLILDLSGVPVISQRGIKAFLRLFRKTEKQGGELEIHGLQPTVRLTLEELGLSKALVRQSPTKQTGKSPTKK
jgi:anti-anti-sigma regulatory factor